MTQHHPEPSASIPTPDRLAQPAGEGQPGALRGAVTLTLETRQAQRLVKGRPGMADRPAIVGLMGFAHLLRAIWHGARADDPYADWWLIQIHTALESAGTEVEASSQAVQSALAACEAITVDPSASVRPVRTPLRFSNPYAYRGAHLLAAYDRLVRATLTARHIGLATRDDAECLYSVGGRDLRRAFLSPVGYRLTGTTRQDVAQGTPKAAQARASMGEIPPDILAGTRRAPHAPIRPLPISDAASHLALQPLPSNP